MRGRLFLLLLLAVDSLCHSAAKRQATSFFQDVVRQRSLGNNNITQCPCVMHPESRQCIAYDSRYQAATIEEAILTFPDLTHDSYFPAPVSSATFLCQTVECQHCFGLLFYRLQDIGFISPSYRPHITLLPRNQLNPRNCPRLRFPLPPPIVPSEPAKPDYVKKMIEAGFRFMHAGGLRPLPRQFSNRNRFRPGPQNNVPVVPGSPQGGRSQSSQPNTSHQTTQKPNQGSHPPNTQHQTTPKPQNQENQPPKPPHQTTQKPQNNQQTNPPRGPNKPQHPHPPQGGQNQRHQQHPQQPQSQVRRPQQRWPQITRPQVPRPQPETESVWNAQARRWEQRPRGPQQPLQIVPPQRPSSNQQSQPGHTWSQPQQPRQWPQQPPNQWGQQPWQTQQQPQVQQQFPQVQQQISLQPQPAQQWQTQVQTQAQPEWPTQQIQQGQWPQSQAWPQQQQQQFSQPAIAQSIAQQALVQSQQAISNPVGQQISVPIQGGGQNGQGQGQSGPPTTILGSIVGNLLGGLHGLLGRKKRAADDPLVGRRFTIACIRRGEASSEDGEFLSLCGSCWTWRELPEDYFPRILNEFSCQENDYCLSGWGTCKQQLRNVDVLRRLDGRWVPQSVTTATCCDCRVKAGTEIHALVVGDRRKTE